MFQWLREYLEIRHEFRERKTRLTHEVIEENRICQSCETLKEQLAFMRDENKILLNKIVKEPEKILESNVAPMITIPKATPWPVRRQLLEQEDRQKARLMREAPKPNSTVTQEDILEFQKELDDAGKNREAQKSS